MRALRVILVFALAVALIAPASVDAWFWNSRTPEPTMQHQSSAVAAAAEELASAPHVEESVVGDSSMQSIDLTTLYRARSLSCATCQRMLAFFDEYLLTALLDVAAAQAKQTPSAFRTNYGALESTIEEAVAHVCSAQSIATNHTMRKSCERMVERHEEALVALYYAHGESMSESEDEGKLGAALCGAKGVLNAGCDDALARLNVQQLLNVEREAAFVRKEDLDPSARAPQEEAKYKSEPERGTTKAGEVQKIVAIDFYKRVIIDRNRDALVYFAFPTKAPEFDFAYAQTHALVAEFMEDSDLLVGTLNVELNDVPPPYNSWASTPSVMLYPANKKENPRWIPLRSQAGEYITGESAPTLADVLTMISKRTQNEKTKKAADWALVDATAEQLHSSRSRENKEEL